MFEQAFKNIDDVLRKEAGCTTELDYTEQTSWLLFLKYLDGLEQDRADEAALDGKKYTYILDQPYRWEIWAAPKGKNGQIDHNAAMEDLHAGRLFYELQGEGLGEYFFDSLFSDIDASYSMQVFIRRSLAITASCPSDSPMPCITRLRRTWPSSGEF